MDKETLYKKLYADLEERKISASSRDKLRQKAFVDPDDPKNCELTINGAQLVVVQSKTAGVPYKFYKIDNELLKAKRQLFIDSIKNQYPNMVFYVCDVQEYSQTIDTENNMLVVDNQDFDVAIDLYGGIDKFFESL